MGSGTGKERGQGWKKIEFQNKLLKFYFSRVGMGGKEGKVDQG